MGILVEQKNGAEISTERRDMREIEHKLIGKILDHAADMTPDGTKLNGLAMVLYFENDGGDGGAFTCVTALKHVNEVFADAGIKTLNNHCKKLFRDKDENSSN